MESDGFDQTITIRGEDCLYNPATGQAQVQCERCGHINLVEVELVDGQARFYGFSCENCGTFNGAD